MYVGRPPRMLSRCVEQPAHRPIRRDGIRLRNHSLELVGAILVDAKSSPEVVVRLPLVPDVVAAIRARLPDVEDRAAQRGTVCGSDPAANKEHVSVLSALVLFVDLHRLLAPGWVLPVERPFHVARCNAALALMGDGVDEYRSLGDVGE